MNTEPKSQPSTKRLLAMHAAMCGAVFAVVFAGAMNFVLPGAGAARADIERQALPVGQGWRAIDAQQTATLTGFAVVTPDPDAPEADWFEITAEPASYTEAHVLDGAPDGAAPDLYAERFAEEISLAALEALAPIGDEALVSDGISQAYAAYYGDRAARLISAKY